jgi:tRNA-dihydrouridine synthase B
MDISSAKSATAEIDPMIKHQIILEHFDKMMEFYGRRGVPIFRKHTHTYSKGYAGASALRDRVNRIDDIDEFRVVLDTFFKESHLV